MRIITHVKFCISALLIGTAFSLHAEWKVDFSRRMPEKKAETRSPASAEFPLVIGVQENMSFVESVVDDSPKEIAQEIVVLNTDKGFIPSTIRVRKGLNYQIHVVNVNDREKNVSFVLDSFSEHHATYYGKIKSFVIRPRQEGVFRFMSPETAAQGQLVVFSPEDEVRLPASER